MAEQRDPDGKIDPAAAAASLVAHYNALRREEIFVANVYSKYGSAIDPALAKLGILEDVQAIAASRGEG